MITPVLECWQCATGPSQVALVVKNLPADAGDAGSIPGSGRSPGGGHGNRLQDSCLENLMGRGAWQDTVHGVAKSRTWLKWLSTAQLNVLLSKAMVSNNAASPFPIGTKILIKLGQSFLLKKKIQTYFTNGAEWQFTSSLRVKGGTVSLHNKIIHTGWCKWQKFIFYTLEFGSPISKCWHFWFLLKPFFLACRWLPSDHVLFWPFACRLISGVFSSFYKDISQIVLGPAHMISVTLNYLFNVRISK